MRHARGVSASIAQRGLSLVELMVGSAIALFIVAAAVALFGTQVREHRSVALEARLAQELRSATDLIGRDLRRAGYWGAAADGVRAAGTEAVAAAANPYAALAPLGAASDAASFRYSRDAVENQRVDSNEQFGFRLRAGVVETELGAGNWQALTDATTLTVTTFTVTPTLQDVDLSGFCARPCAASAGCSPPTLQIRGLVLSLAARLVTDPSVARSLRSEVRLRNDTTTGTCPA